MRPRRRRSRIRARTGSSMWPCWRAVEKAGRPTIPVAGCTSSPWGNNVTGGQANEDLGRPAECTRDLDIAIRIIRELAGHSIGAQHRLENHLMHPEIDFS